ncbi:MBL fold metallo-hydrolase RNA specificity domain-containing protein [Prosthecobacter sp.]|uniref:MBL fold metallo-hydrolase RNA specificity domain-containing protein n=1 Tax=Prosthecobacter sp. TaxID=1965333 RepID=UPI0024887FCD|nr:MBL fold metallo-hydrolase RNA specificity domain-containing protein [Prosthecobacter sp.]MDI1311700.1 MBL fold metallo-hydrolase RNA specificity domain-containing protein [Prosthecobacter sp.]
MPPLIEVTHPRGIYLPEADLWLDPHFGRERAFVSHAHSDHVARHGLTICTEITHQLMVVRKAAKKAGIVVSPQMREVFEWEGWKIRLLPAGHITGSAMLHLTRKIDGATLLYTGDYKLRQGLSAERCELMQADTLIMETTFGLPKYHFPPAEDVIAQMLAFVRDTLRDGGIPVLLGYSLGKAQEILCALGDEGLPVMVHPSVAQITEVLAPHLGKLPQWRLFKADEVTGHVLVFPPGSKLELPKMRTAMLSGWAIQASAKYRYGVDLALPLSDHADYPELHETVEMVKPRRIYLVHGSTREFAAELRLRGYDARALGKEDQLELSLSAH